MKTMCVCVCVQRGRIENELKRGRTGNGAITDSHPYSAYIHPFIRLV